jgi:hypothetical protein
MSGMQVTSASASAIYEMTSGVDVGGVFSEACFQPELALAACATEGCRDELT